VCGELSLKLGDHKARRDARADEARQHVARAKFMRDRMQGNHGPIV
jgi:hypothetical protein